MKIYKINHRKVTRWLSRLTFIALILTMVVLTSCQDVNGFLKSILAPGQTTDTGKPDPSATTDKPGLTNRHEFKQEGLRFEIILNQGLDDLQTQAVGLLQAEIIWQPLPVVRHSDDHAVASVPEID